MLLYITGGVGFVFCILALLLIAVLHKKNKSKLIPLIMYALGFVLFLGSGFLHWKGFELKIPFLESKEETVQTDAGQDAPETEGENSPDSPEEEK